MRPVTDDAINYMRIPNSFTMTNGGCIVMVEAAALYFMRQRP